MVPQRNRKTREVKTRDVGHLFFFLRPQASTTKMDVAVLVVHGGPGVPIPPAKLRALRRSASVPVSSYTQHQHHEDLASVIDELDAEVEKRKKNGRRVVLCARPWGAAIALQYACAHADKIAGALLFSLPTMHVTTARRRLCLAALRRLEQNEPGALTDWERARPPGRELSAAQRLVRARTQARYCALGFYGIASRLTRAALATATAPILIVQGEHDRASFAQGVTSRLPNARLAIIRGRAHSLSQAEEALYLRSFVAHVRNE